MVNKCAAYGCKSGYAKQDESIVSASKLTFHAFPLNNEELCAQWVKANPRKDFVPTKNSKICSLHFQPNDFIAERQDSNSQRRKSMTKYRSGWNIYDVELNSGQAERLL